MQKLSKFKSLVVVAIFFVACGLTFLFGTTRTTYTMPNLEKQQTDALMAPEGYTASFSAYHSRLRSISIEPNQVAYNEGSLMLILSNEFGEEIARDTIECSELKYGYMNEFMLNAKLVQGDTYNITVIPENCDGAIALSIMDHSLLLTENTYYAPITKRGMMPYVLGYALFAMLIIAAMEDRKAYSKIAAVSTYGLFLIAAVALFMMNDEGYRELRYQGVELNHASGYEDYRGYLTASPDTSKEGVMCYSDSYMLHAGEYTINLSYLTGDEGNTIEVIDDELGVYSFDINPTGTYGEYTFSFDKDTQNTVINVYYCGTGVLKINELKLKPAVGKSFYSDNMFMLVVFLILNAAGIYLFHRNKKKPISKETLADAVVIIAIASFGLYPFITSNMGTGDDLSYHLMRIEGLKDAILDGQFPAVVMPNALSGNGYLNSMYPYLFLYIPAVLRVFNVSLILSYKVLIFLANLATAALTYIGVKSVCNSRYGALLSAMVYVCLPYRFNNIYARGALGEILAMTFLPFLFAAVYHLLLGDRKKWYWIIIALSGLLQSHIISFVIGCMMTAVACILFLRELLSEKRWLDLIKAAAISALVNIWFLVPFVWFYFNGQLGKAVLDWAGFAEYTCDPAYFLNMIGQDHYRYLSFGVPVAALIIFGIYHVTFEAKNHDGARERYFRLLYVMAALLTLLITAYGASYNWKNIYIIDRLMTTIQFPWRLFAQASALFIFTGAVWMAESEALNRANMKRGLFIAIAFTCSFVGMRGLGKFENYSTEVYTDQYTAGHETKVRGIAADNSLEIYPYEYRMNGVDDENLLIYYFIDKPETTDIIEYSKNGTSVDVVYKATEADTTITIPVMNYYGYCAMDESGNPVEITQVRDYAMLCSLIDDGQQHTLSIRYKEPGLFVISMWISIISFVSVLVIPQLKRKVKE